MSLVRILSTSRSSLWGAVASAAITAVEVVSKVSSKTPISPVVIVPCIAALGFFSGRPPQEKLDWLVGSLKGSIGTAACSYLLSLSGFPPSQAISLGGVLSGLINGALGGLQHLDEKYPAQRRQNRL